MPELGSHLEHLPLEFRACFDHLRVCVFNRLVGGGGETRELRPFKLSRSLRRRGFLHQRLRLRLLARDGRLESLRAGQRGGAFLLREV